LAFNVRSLFTPAAPISKAELFAGRREQLDRLFEAIAETGRHAVLFGERGVGKTSLGNVFHELLTNQQGLANVVSIRKQASPADNYSSLWRKVFRDMVFERRLKGAYGNDEVQSGSISDRYPDEIEPDDVVREIGRFAEQTHPIIVFDEFDRITDQSTKRVMSHTIKALSDTGITATIVLVGVADDINSLVEEHASVTRNISEIKMPRMSTDELNLILSNRYVKVGMAIDGDARWKIVALSRGLPEFVHSLGRSAALHAIGEKRLKITESDVDAAFCKSWLNQINPQMQLIKRQLIVIGKRRCTGKFCSPAPSPRPMMKVNLRLRTWFSRLAASSARRRTSPTSKIILELSTVMSADRYWNVLAKSGLISIASRTRKCSPTC